MQVPVLFGVFEIVLEILFFVFQVLIFRDSKRLLVVVWILLFIWKNWGFWASLVMDPGFITKGDKIGGQEFGDFDEKLFCQVCSLNRPARSYHCKKCQRCVMIRDHHCYFIGNCVGYRNQRAFLVFLISYIIHSFISVFFTFFSLYRFPKTPANIGISFIMVFNLIVLDFFVFNQLIPQLRHLIRNETSIEFLKERNKSFENSSTIVSSRYDTGSIMKNLRQRLGSNAFMWIFPLANDELLNDVVQNTDFIPLSEGDMSNMRTSPTEPLSALRKRSYPRI